MSRDSIFINYRRSDSSGYAGRIRDHLVPRFGAIRIFMDVGILGGEDWVTSIERALSASGTLLAVIGPTWSSPRLQDPGDRLRQELEAAIRLGVVIIPVLVADARMPHEDDLPPSLRALTRHQAVRLTDQGWDDDMRRLVKRLQGLVSPGVPRGAGEPGPTPAPSPLGRLIATVIVVAIVAGGGFVVYQIIRGPFGPPDGANAKITLSPTSGSRGTTITVTGTGFPANSTVDLRLQGPYGDTESDGQGAFTSTVVVPKDTPFTGKTEVIASSGAFSDSATFDIIP
jgi:hypothetical protein